MKHHTKASASQTVAPDDAADVERPAAQLSAEERQQPLLGLLRAITDHLGEGIYALDSAGCVTFMNPAAERLLGWTEAELLGKDMHATIHFQHADGTPFPREECPLLRVMQSGQIDRVEDDTFTRRDGAMFPVAYVSSPISTGGAVTGATLAFHDITAHKAMDEALRRSEREAASRASQLLAIFESMADPVIVYDREGNILQANAADAELLGAQVPQERSGRTLAQRSRVLPLLDQHGDPIPSDHLPSTRVLNGEVLRGSSVEDVFVRTANGREIVLNASGAPVRDAEGTIVGGVLIRRDVTERRRLERQTREALTALMAMAEALVGDIGPQATQTSFDSETVARRIANVTRAVMGCERVNIVSVDPDSDTMQVAAIAGLSPEQEWDWQANWPQAGRLDDYLPHEMIEQLKLGQTLIIDRAQPPFNRWTNPFGSRTLVVVPMRVGERLLGEMAFDYGTVEHHVTADEHAMAEAVAKLAAQVIERDRLARERETARANALALVEATRRMDEFLSIAAHELKTPVTSGKLAVTLAIDTLNSVIAQRETMPVTEPGPGTATPALIQGLLERTGNHMDRLSRLVVDLLDVSRIHGGKLEMRVTPCNLANIVREVAEEQRQLMPGRVIHLRLPAASRRPPVVLADADRIRQVVANYLSNALKYSREDQAVRVHLRTDVEWALVSVRDEGPGVPAAEQRHVWERFYRVAGTQVRSGTGVGLGLGLHISRTIIEQHDGRVGLRSVEGKGTTFWFALQLLDDARGWADS
ncbi:MAG TPA: PAS domain S-box protein [Ktedonobacterales bacterium]|nr:PAS domain S-box protein [Ktedonobacterales bacterium]